MRKGLLCWKGDSEGKCLRGWGDSMYSTRSTNVSLACSPFKKHQGTTCVKWNIWEVMEVRGLPELSGIPSFVPTQTSLLIMLLFNPERFSSPWTWTKSVTYQFLRFTWGHEETSTKFWLLEGESRGFWLRLLRGHIWRIHLECTLLYFPTK